MEFEFEVGSMDQEYSGPEDRFVIDTVEKAEWALSKLGNWDAEEKRIKAQAQAMLNRIATDRDKFLSRFEADLEAFAKAQIEAAGGKRKSVDTLQGTLAFRKVPPQLAVVDREAALAYARQHAPTAVAEVLNATEYRESALLALQQNGEVLPGMELKPERESFSIRFKESAE